MKTLYKVLCVCLNAIIGAELAIFRVPPIIAIPIIILTGVCVGIAIFPKK